MRERLSSVLRGTVFMGMVIVLMLWGCAGQTPRMRLSLEEYLSRADSCTALCDWDCAEAYLNEAIRLFPTRIEPWLRRGFVLEERNDLHRARAFWNRILKVRPEEKDAIAGRWRVLEAMNGSTDEDLRNIIRQDVRRWDSVRPRTRLSMELAYMGWRLLGEVSAADSVGRILSFRHPESPEGKAHERRMYRRTVEPYIHDNDRLIPALSKFITNHPSSPWRSDAYTLLARACEEQRDFASLARTLRDFRNDMPNDPRALELSARSYLEYNLGDYRALQYARRAVDALVNFPRPEIYSPGQWARERCRLMISGSTRHGQALLRRGDIETAQRVIEDVLANPEIQSSCSASPAGAYVILAEIYFSRGNSNLAIDALVEALIRGDPEGSWERRARALLSRALKELNIDTKPVYYARGLKRYDGPRFRDITSRAGLDGYSGGTVTWVDYDADGRDDICLNGSVLLRNGPGSRFEDVTSGLRFPKGRFSAGLWGDIENDGIRDVLLIRDTPTTTAQLYHYTTDGFKSTAQVIFSESILRGAAFLDVDTDGDLDILLTRETDSSTDRGADSGVMLFVNNGDGTFHDAASQYRMEPFPDSGSGVSSMDFDADGDMDILVTTSDSTPLRLWTNSNGVFRNESCTAGLREQGSFQSTSPSIRCDWGDYDGDGYADLFCTEHTSPWDLDSRDQSALIRLIRSKPLRFERQDSTTGIDYAGSFSEPTWCDFDTDGDLDLFLVADNTGRGTRLYLNENGTFTDATYLSGLAVSNATGCAPSDFDRDGDYDLLVSTTQGLRLFRNETGGTWLAVTVVGNGITTNVDCLGCRIEIESNDFIQMREISDSKSTMNQRSLTRIFGLRDTVDVSTIRVRFTDGEVMELPGVAPNQLVVIHQ